METKNTPAPVKKQWQKPMIYLLDSANVESGIDTNSHEVNNGKQSAIKTHNGAIVNNFTPFYINYAHS